MTSKEEDILFEDFLVRTIKALNKSTIDYVLIGGVAVTILGRPRSTMDVDIIIENDEAKIKKLEICLREQGFDVQHNEILEAIEEGRHCSIFMDRSIYRIDIKTPTRELEQSALKNKKQMTLLREKTYVQIPEEIVVAKLIYGSEQDIEDAFSIILRNKEVLDFDLLHQLAERERVSKQLDELLGRLKRT